MDGFTIGVILKALLASAGLKATVVLCCLGAFLYAVWKSVQAVAGFFERLINNRDAMLANLSRDLKASDERRSALDRETAAILATLHAKVDTQISQHDETRKGIDQIKDNLNVLKGAVS